MFLLSCAVLFLAFVLWRNEKSRRETNFVQLQIQQRIEMNLQDLISSLQRIEDMLSVKLESEMDNAVFGDEKIYVETQSEIDFDITAEE